MFRAIGVVIVLWYVSSLFSNAFSAADRAFGEVFNALEAVAVSSRYRFEK